MELIFLCASFQLFLKFIATPEAVKMEQQQLEVTTADQVDNSDNKSNSSKISESKFQFLYVSVYFELCLIS